MSIPYTPDFADAAQDAFAGQAFDDPGSSAYAAADPARVDAKYFLKPVQDEILALQAGRVASASYRRTWTCIAGLAVGDPVYVSANDTVTKADATTATKAQVIGFVRYKPTATSCYIEHFRHVSGLSGGTAGAPVYLSDAGGFSASAGTVTKIVGQWITATEALLNASQMSALASGGTGGTASYVPKFASATTLGLSAYGDDGTYGTLMAVGSSTFNDANTRLKWRGTTVPASFLASSGSGADIFFRAQSAASGGGGNGANIYFMPGSADGAGTAGRFRVCLAGDATKYVDIYKDAFGNAFFVNSESGGYTLFKIGGTTVFAIAQSITTSAANAAQGAFGFWTDKSYSLGAAGSASDITVGRKSASILRLTAGAETDASTFLMASGSGSAPSAFTNSSDTNGKDCIFRTQSGGTHSAANPRGGNFVVRLGAKGSGGTGNEGEFLVENNSGAGILGCRTDRINRQDFWTCLLPTSAPTSDATPTTVNSLTLSDNCVYHIRVRVLGVRTDGTVRETHEFLLTAYRTGGGATIQDATTVHAPGAPTWTVACAASGNDINVDVTGGAYDINWTSQIEYARLSE